MRNINYLKVIKDNFEFIILLPPLVGGIWQIIELSSISLSFIRFFSVTQLVADGILILCITVSVIVSFLIYPLYIYFLHPKKEYENFENEKSKDIIKISYIDKFPILGYLFLIIVTPIFLIIIKYLAVIDFKDFSIYTIITSIYYVFSVRFLINERKKSIKHSKNVHSLSTIVIVFLSYIYFTSLGSIFHNLFTFPKNLVNYNNLILKIKNDNNDSKVEILYLNDKYIFVKISEEKSKKSKIKILNFEKLTED